MSYSKSPQRTPPALQNARAAFPTASSIAFALALLIWNDAALLAQSEESISVFVVRPSTEQPDGIEEAADAEQLQTLLRPGSLAVPTSRQFDRRIYPIDPTLPLPENPMFQLDQAALALTLRCAQAANRLASSIGSAGDAPHVFAGDSAAAVAALGTPIADWVDACLETIDSPRPGVSIDAVRAAVGLLSVNSNPFCTAFVARDDTVISARHCFSRRNDGANPAGRALSECVENPQSCGALSFQLTTTGSVPLPVVGVKRPPIPFQEPIALGDDYVVLTVQGDLPEVKVALVELSDQAPVFLAGFLPYLSADEVAAEQRQLYWSKDIPNACQAWPAKNRCVVHSCQALWAFSGAPIIRAASLSDGVPTVEVVGLHVGALTTARPCWVPSATGFNVGLTATRVGL